MHVCKGWSAWAAEKAAKQSCINKLENFWVWSEPVCLLGGELNEGEVSVDRAAQWVHFPSVWVPFILSVCQCVYRPLLSVSVYLRPDFVSVRFFAWSFVFVFLPFHVFFLYEWVCLSAVCASASDAPFPAHKHTHTQYLLLWTVKVLCNHLYKEVLVFPSKRNIGNIVAQLGGIPPLPWGQDDCRNLITPLVSKMHLHQSCQQPLFTQQSTICLAFFPLGSFFLQCMGGV